MYAPFQHLLAEWCVEISKIAWVYEINLTRNILNSYKTEWEHNICQIYVPITGCEGEEFPYLHHDDDVIDTQNIINNLFIDLLQIDIVFLKPIVLDDASHITLCITTILYVGIILLLLIIIRALMYFEKG